VFDSPFLQAHTLQKPSETSFLSLSEQSASDGDYIDNMEQESTEDKSEISPSEFANKITEDYSKSLFEVDSLKTVQNGLLRKLNNLLINNQILLAEKVGLEKSKKENIKKEEDDETTIDDILDSDQEGMVSLINMG
jgi:hypothetical protein